MSEKRMTYLGGFTLGDFMQESDDILLGTGGVFTVAVLARCFPGLPVAGVLLLDNTDDFETATSGYGFLAALNGVNTIGWGDGAARQTILVTQDVPVAPGATCLTVVRFDGPNDITEMFVGGSKIAEEIGVGTGIEVAAPDTPTNVGAFFVGGENVANNANAGLSGIAITAGLLTDQEIADHADAVLEDLSMADTGVWDALWDARSGIPNANPETTEWLDEISAAPIARVVTTPTLASQSGRPRFL
jgi:hypothetical protein